MKYERNRPCKKCGAKYHKDTYLSPPLAATIAGEKVQEFIRRECRNCGYTWTEETLDTASSASAKAG